MKIVYTKNEINAVIDLTVVITKAAGVDLSEEDIREQIESPDSFISIPGIYSITKSINGEYIIEYSEKYTVASLKLVKKYAAPITNLVKTFMSLCETFASDCMELASSLIDDASDEDTEEDK